MNVCTLHTSERFWDRLYSDFLEKVRLPAGRVDEWLGSKYARHFYSDAELAKIRRRWVEGKAAKRGG